MKRRWVCPRECGGNVLAPGKMRRDDARRYCLGCTEKTGRLVARVCPALEREREQAREQRRAAEKRKRERASRAKARAKRRREQRYIVMGYDVRALVNNWMRLDAWDRDDGDRVDGWGDEGGWHVFRARRYRAPDIVVRRGRRKDYISAHAHGNYRITMTVPRSWDEAPSHAQRADLLVTVLHEMAHLAIGCHHGHDMAFNAMLCRAAAEVWGDELAVPPTYGDGGYGPTSELERRLADHLKQLDGGWGADA